MRIKFEYPLATEENMKWVQNAINAGADITKLLESFPEEVIWDCVVVLSGNENTPWALLDHMDDNLQTSIEDWQNEIIENYIWKCQDDDGIVKNQTLYSKATPLTGAEYAIGIQDKVLVIFDCDGSCEAYEGQSWDYCLLDVDGNEIDGGGQYDDENKPLGELIEELIEEYNLSAACNWKLCDFEYYHSFQT